MEQNPSYSPEQSRSGSKNTTDKPAGGYNSISAAPQISLPKGGGAIRSTDEKSSVNAANGSSGFSIPFPFSASRNGFMPGMELSYNSGSGNGIFGLGWTAEPASIARRTDKKLPEYIDEKDSDIFIFSGMEDLIPLYNEDDTGNWTKDRRSDNGSTITRYRPRIDGSFSRIEKITEANGNVYWKTTNGSNVVSVFGKSRSAQLSDPSDPKKIFKWLFEFSYDDKGNCYQFEYKKEDTTNVPNQLHEKNRLNGFSSCTNLYLKKIKYGNKVHFNRSTIDLSDWDGFLSSIGYLLELVLDYGEHDPTNPQPDDDKGWPCRTDAYSDYRPGFEIRTFRLCRRVLMFHLFSELGTTPCLVRSIDMDYDEGAAFTFLRSVAQKGYIRKGDGSYSQKSLPPIEFSYERLGWNTEMRTLPKNSLTNMPGGLDGQAYIWIDLYKEGISGILTEQSGAWYYKSNAGDGCFEDIRLISSKPSLTSISTGAFHFADIEAKGQQFLVSTDLNGYYELGDDQQWLPYKNFEEIPNLNLHDPNLRMLDLNGDGMADILITENEVFTWYASKGKGGFESYNKLPKALDEEKGPNMVFADSTESIFLADMSGDGLPDIVRIRFSEVSYWPNLGYGKFGVKVNMGNAPVMDNENNFNPKYLKLADLDGSGTTDLIYLAHDSFKVYYNQSGNSFSEINLQGDLNPIPFQSINDHTQVNFIDLLGNGTLCIVWSSPLPQYDGRQLQYIDLMGGKKPHVMNGYKNNTGKEVNITYKPSTYYYLQDKRSGTPWITKLPFPVQCVSDVEMIDRITNTRFTHHYSYHHGYYDHREREFRGFGRVDQTDTEDFEGLHQPPTLTKTWYHTGAFLDKEKIFAQFSHEYYSNSSISEKELADPALPAGLTIDEWAEASRACKGIVLRAEVYSLDGSDQQQHPYTTSHHSCLIQLLQPRMENLYAAFMVQQSESLTYSYERDPADPRVTHTMTIETDKFGNVLKTAAISYGRKISDPALTPAEQAEQSKIHIVWSQGSFTNSIDTSTDYHLPVSAEAITCELTGMVPGEGAYFTITEIKNGFDQAIPIAHETVPLEGIVQRRIMGQARSIFLKDDLTGPLPPGVIESLALPYQSYKLSITPGLRDFIFGDKVDDELLLGKGKYVHFNDDNYWIPSGTQTRDAGHFYQVTEMIDPFGFKARITFDSNYRFFVEQTVDEAGNTSKVLGFNYRTLSPYLMSGFNDNRMGVRSDELDIVISGFVMGKAGEEKGDSMDTGSVEASANDQPGSIMAYEALNYKNNGSPNFTKTSLRDTHYFESVQTGKEAVWQTSYAYSDGSGQLVMQKVQATPGIALEEHEDGTVSEVDTTPNLRWIGNGRTILDNKGNPVKQYESYFSTSFEFEDSKLLVERGVTMVKTYDAAGRAIRTDMPDGTFTRVAYDSWSQQISDQNDTVLESQWYQDRITKPVAAIATPEEVSAANKAAVHANTPAAVHLDSLGRGFLSVADNGAAGRYKTYTETDIEGNLRKITDAAGNIVIQYKYDMLGAQLYHNSMDAGERWAANDVMGKPLCAWDSRGHKFRYEYDALHRPIKSFVSKGDAAEVNTEKMTYGEGITDDKELNLRGTIYQHYDPAGVAVTLQFDFKGNPLQGSRQFLKDYKNEPDWTLPGGNELESTVFISSRTFDALNRVVKWQMPEGSIIRPVYSDGGLLNQVWVSIKGSTEEQFVKEINHDAKGQRQNIVYGNDTSSTYQYDPKTFRLTQLLTTGKNGTDLLQQCQYTYDPVGNISFIKDKAQADVFFNNTLVKAENDYLYDAVYQLIQASGREHAGQNNLNETGANNNIRNFPFENAPNANDAQAFRNYTQRFVYDPAGNIKQLQHIAGTGGYSRTFRYNNDDADRDVLNIDPQSIKNNQLLATVLGGNTLRYGYDAHGNMLDQPQLQGLVWNSRDELQQADLGGGGKAYYVYDGIGQRVRKIIERQGGIREERIYLGGFELYRRTDSGGNIQETTETLQVMDDNRRIALIETKDAQSLVRYQHSNHLGSSSLELDGNAAIISYEEYHPFGTTSYQANNTAINAAYKRYRYTGMERDEETGLEYHSARYYLPWLGRWLSADPIGLSGGINLYGYCGNNPVIKSDPSGTERVWPWDKDATFFDVRVRDIADVGVGIAESVAPILFSTGYAPLAAQTISSIKNKSTVEVVNPLDGLKKLGKAFATVTGADRLGSPVLFCTNCGFDKEREQKRQKEMSEAIETLQQLNPAYNAMVDVYEAKNAFENHDYREAGRRIGSAGTDVAEAVTLAAGIAESASRVLVRPRIATPRLPGRPPAPSSIPKPLAPSEGIPIATSSDLDATPRINTNAASKAPTSRHPSRVVNNGYGWRAYWDGDPIASIMFEVEGDTVIGLDTYRGSEPPGSAGKMFADSIKEAGISRPRVIRSTSIINKETLDALATGKPYLETRLGKLMQRTVDELGGKIEKIVPSEYNHKPAYDFYITYPR